MELYGLDILATLQAADDERELFSKLVAYATSLGFEYVCYGLQAPVPVSHPQVEILDAYPAGWMSHYQQRGFLAVDPTVQLGRLSPRPVVWSDETFASARSLWNDARDFGLVTGISQSSWAANGIFGLLSFARSAGVVEPGELEHLTERINWLAGVTHTLMCRFIAPRFATQPDIPLTAREKDVLRWSAEGKTASEIGMILNIAERTVNFHVNNILVKLNATNKIQAAVRAALLGLL
jgi:LuxR family quorum-sensing system transcriptional regulator SolR